MSFDHLAPIYRPLELLLAGSQLQRARLAQLPALDDCPPQHALLVGEGPGRFLEVAWARWPHTRFTVVDASAGMLAVAEQRLRQRADYDAARVCFVTQPLPLPAAAAAAWAGAGEPPGAFGRADLIVTHCFLDCFTAKELAQVVPQLAAQARPDASWLITDFQVPTETGWRRTRARLILWLMYRTFRVATAIPARSWTAPDDALQAAGFTLERRATALHGLIRSDLWRRKARTNV